MIKKQKNLFRKDVSIVLLSTALAVLAMENGEAEKGAGGGSVDTRIEAAQDKELDENLQNVSMFRIDAENTRRKTNWATFNSSEKEELRFFAKFAGLGRKVQKTRRFS